MSRLRHVAHQKQPDRNDRHADQHRDAPAIGGEHIRRHRAGEYKADQAR
ncbi:MAG: hypothetical protein WDM89_20645 [Rhizomicrobium sp.]